ncbi:hypothetical protein PLICRDRAFT_653416 [Plicaturopsis crispa FD-325 SS-3]|nr:hypothetical protein PLICRDRAFT_653416 [Plicaturopsis crispa FD-325 SS-3]
MIRCRQLILNIAIFNLWLSNIILICRHTSIRTSTLYTCSVFTSVFGTVNASRRVLNPSFHSPGLPTGDYVFICLSFYHLCRLLQRVCTASSIALVCTVPAAFSPGPKSQSNEATHHALSLGTV